MHLLRYLHQANMRVCPLSRCENTFCRKSKAGFFHSVFRLEASFILPFRLSDPTGLSGLSVCAAGTCESARADAPARQGITFSDLLITMRCDCFISPVRQDIDCNINHVAFIFARVYISLPLCIVFS